MWLLGVKYLAWIADKIRVNTTWWIGYVTLISKKLEKINLTFEEREKMSRNNYFYSISLVRSWLSLTRSRSVVNVYVICLEFPFIKWHVINNNVTCKMIPLPLPLPFGPLAPRWAIPHRSALVWTILLQFTFSPLFLCRYLGKLGKGITKNY